VENGEVCAVVLFVAVQLDGVALVLLGVYKVMLMLRSTSAAPLVVSRLPP
jgi:hypothetical protein